MKATKHKQKSLRTNPYRRLSSIGKPHDQEANFPVQLQAELQAQLLAQPVPMEVDYPVEQPALHLNIDNVVQAFACAGIANIFDPR